MNNIPKACTLMKNFTRLPTVHSHIFPYQPESQLQYQDRNDEVREPDGWQDLVSTSSSWKLRLEFPNDLCFPGRCQWIVDRASQISLGNCTRRLSRIEFRIHLHDLRSPGTIISSCTIPVAACFGRDSSSSRPLELRKVWRRDLPVQYTVKGWKKFECGLLTSANRYEDITPSPLQLRCSQLIPALVCLTEWFSQRRVIIYPSCPRGGGDT